MKLRSVTAREGVQWMLAGLRAVRQQPFALASLLSFQMLGLGLLLGFPLVGPMLVTLLLPAISAGWVCALDAMATGQRPTPAHWLSPLKTRSTRRPLLQLGTLHTVLAVLLISVAEWLDPGMSNAWETLREGDVQDEVTASALQALQIGMVLRATLLLPLVLTFWHAPVILLRTDSTVGKALFVSATTSWHHLGAFVVYGLCWILADLALSVVLSIVMGILGLGGAAVMVVVLPCALLFSAAFYASLKATVDGCLEFEASDASPSPGNGLGVPPAL